MMHQDHPLIPCYLPPNITHAMLSARCRSPLYHAICPGLGKLGDKFLKLVLKLVLVRQKKASFLTYSFSDAYRPVLYRLYGTNAQKICAQRSFYTFLMYIKWKINEMFAIAPESLFEKSRYAWHSMSQQFTNFSEKRLLFSYARCDLKVLCFQIV